MALSEGRVPLLDGADFDENMMESPETESGRGGVDNIELSGCGGTCCCDPRRPCHRFIVLIFMCLLGFGSYFCYDNPGALQDYFISDMDITTAEYTNLYAWYSWPNVFLCFVGGFLIDRVFGIRWGTIIFSTFVVAGQIVFALGGFLDQFWVMEAGRFIFGIGGESLAVAQNTYAVSWFKGKELNMVFGLQLSFARVGSTVNFLVMEPVYKWAATVYPAPEYASYTVLGFSLALASATCIMSLLCALILAFFDKRAEKILQRQLDDNKEVVRLKDVKDFSLSFWMITLICVTYYVAIFPFISLGKVFFERKFEFSPTSANTVNSIVYIISAFASPVLGYLVDRTGRNVMWVIIAVIVTLVSHALLAFTFLNPYVAMVIMGVAYSLLASALWPMVSMVVAEHQLGTAYGIMQSVQNLGLAVVAIIAGNIVDSKGYLVLEVFFLACVCIALVACIILWMWDESKGGQLMQSAVVRKAEEAKNKSVSKDALVPTGSIN